MPGPSHARLRDRYPGARGLTAAIQKIPLSVNPGMDPAAEKIQLSPIHLVELRQTGVLISGPTATEKLMFNGMFLVDQFSKMAENCSITLARVILG